MLQNLSSAAVVIGALRVKYNKGVDATKPAFWVSDKARLKSVSLKLQRLARRSKIRL